jgi:hypothetical protein
MAQRPAVTISPNPGVPPIVGTIEAAPAQVSGAVRGSVQAAAAQTQAQAAGAQRIPRSLERVELFLRVLLRMYIGIAVCLAPWFRLFWDQNPLIAQFPSLAVYLDHGAVRGIVSGVGLLNLWIAFRDAIRRRDG